MGTKRKLLSIPEKLTITNIVDHVTNEPCAKIPEDLCISLIEVTDKMLAHSHRCECVSSAAGSTNSACVCITFSQKLKQKIEHFSSTLL